MMQSFIHSLRRGVTKEGMLVCMRKGIFDIRRLIPIWLGAFLRLLLRGWSSDDGGWTTMYVKLDF